MHSIYNLWMRASALGATPRAPLQCKLLSGVCHIRSLFVFTNEFNKQTAKLYRISTIIPNIPESSILWVLGAIPQLHDVALLGPRTARHRRRLVFPNLTEVCEIPSSHRHCRYWDTGLGHLQAGFMRLYELSHHPKSCHHEALKSPSLCDMQ
jgi:hypothetical protein